MQPTSFFEPIKVTITLRNELGNGIKWRCTINGEKREVLSQRVCYFVKTLAEAVGSFDVKEVINFEIKGRGDYEPTPIP